MIARSRRWSGDAKQSNPDTFEQQQMESHAINRERRQTSPPVVESEDLQEPDNREKVIRGSKEDQRISAGGEGSESFFDGPLGHLLLRVEEVSRRDLLEKKKGEACIRCSMYDCRR